LNRQISRIRMLLTDVIKELDFVEQMGAEIEIQRLSTKEDLFYELLKLPPDAIFARFFYDISDSVDLTIAMIGEFRKKYPESFEKLGQSQTPLPPEMRAFNGYLWMKTTDLDSFKGRDNISSWDIVKVAIRLSKLDYQ